VQASNWPLVLAGPIVRRVEPKLASVRVALKQPATIRLEIWHGLETAATAWPPWRMFSLSTDPRQAASSALARDYLFLPPALGPTLQGQAVEEVLLMRDELANLAWAIERVVENRVGAPVDRRDGYRRHEEGAPPSSYRLTTEVPDYWIPLVPVRQPNENGIRLQRGALARPGPQGPARAQGRIMSTPGPLLLFDEEVPRSGARISAAYEYARWIDGSTHVWRGRRKETGRGESASGLRYDVGT